MLRHMVSRSGLHCVKSNTMTVEVTCSFFVTHLRNHQPC